MQKTILTRYCQSKNFENRSAKFITVIALILNGKQFFKGECKGYITKIARGKDGFGYDPIFQPLKSKLTFAEMNQSEKGKLVTEELL